MSTAACYKLISPAANAFLLSFCKYLYPCHSSTIKNTPIISDSPLFVLCTPVPWMSSAGTTLPDDHRLYCRFLLGQKSLAWHEFTLRIPSSVLQSTTFIQPFITVHSFMQILVPTSISVCRYISELIQPVICDTYMVDVIKSAGNGSHCDRCGRRIPSW